MKDIVIIANFVAELDGGANSRFTYLANLLYENNNVEIIASDFSHGNKKKRDVDTKKFSYKVTLVHEPGYPKNICLKRFRSHQIWGNNVEKYLLSRKKPDVVYCAVPSLTAASKAADYCSKNDIKFIIDIQDLWPEAFQMVFHIPLVSEIIFSPFKKLANKIYASADEIIAVSQTYVDRALFVNKKNRTGHSIFLGTKLETFDDNVNMFPCEKPKDEFWIGYCGTLGSSYDLICVIDALTIIKNEYDNCIFVVMGDGPRRAEFEKYAKKQNINCIFTGRLPYPEMCGRLAACDIVVNPITHGAAQSIINKHADYAASGLPVINTQECKEYRDLVNQYNMGYNCENNNASDLANKIKALRDNSELRKSMGINARRCAEEKFDRKNTYLEIMKVVTQENECNS